MAAAVTPLSFRCHSAVTRHQRVASTNSTSPTILSIPIGTRHIILVTQHMWPLDWTSNWLPYPDIAPRARYDQPPTEGRHSLILFASIQPQPHSSSGAPQTDQSNSSEILPGCICACAFSITPDNPVTFFHFACYRPNNSPFCDYIIDEAPLVFASLCQVVPPKTILPLLQAMYQ